MLLLAVVVATLDGASVGVLELAEEVTGPEPGDEEEVGGGYLGFVLWRVLVSVEVLAAGLDKEEMAREGELGGGGDDGGSLL